MALEDFLEPEVGIAVALTAAIGSPRVRKVLRKGAVYGLAGILAAKDKLGDAAGTAAEAAKKATAKAKAGVAAATAETSAPGEPAGEPVVGAPATG